MIRGDSTVVCACDILELPELLHSRLEHLWKAHLLLRDVTLVPGAWFEAKSWAGVVSQPSSVQQHGVVSALES